MAELTVLARLVDFDWTELRGRCILFASHARDARGAPVAYAAQFDACAIHVPDVANCESGCLTHEAWVFPADVWALDAGIVVPKALSRAPSVTEMEDA